MWPNGTFTKELTATETLKGLSKTQWAWKNNRSDRLDLTTGFKTTHYVCQGVWRCVNCQWTLRPMIRPETFDTQRGCPLLPQYLHNRDDMRDLSQCCCTSSMRC